MGSRRSIYRAAYDPAAPGKLRWDKDPELTGTGRIMGLAEADGVLYAAADIKDETPFEGCHACGGFVQWEVDEPIGGPVGRIGRPAGGCQALGFRKSHL